jgi:dTDP-4-dehydrorhamnose reductase
MRVLVTGSGGQLGSKVVESLLEDGRCREVRGIDLPELDITLPQAVGDLVGSFRPDWIVNCAAYTDVEQAEEEPEAAYRVNALALGTLADAALRHGSRLLHISTDYVFSGRVDSAGRLPLTEDAPPGPINVYGASKLAGEILLQNHEVSALVLRTSWLYGGPGKNFLHTMLRAGRKAAAGGGSLRVVHDQIGTPTDVWSLARQIAHLLPRDVTGLLHASAHGEATWCDFARAIFSAVGLCVDVEPVTSAEYPTRARRPAYSVLRNARLEASGLDLLPQWREGLEKAIRRIGHTGE